MRKNPHAKLLCMLAYQKLSNGKANLFARMSVAEVKMSIERLVEELLTFFADADSFSREWLMPETDPANELERYLEEGVSKVTIDGEEIDAVEKAKLGDFRDIENLILDRGYLRTAAAREAVVNRLRGIKKRGSPATKVNSDTFLQVATIRIQENCSEFRAKQIWLERNNDVKEETLNSRLRRAKNLEELEIVKTILSVLQAKSSKNA